MHEVAVLLDKEVEAMSRPFQTPDVTREQNMPKVRQQCVCFLVENSIFLWKCNQKILLCCNKLYSRNQVK